jgi:hypothetical protein
MNRGAGSESRMAPTLLKNARIFDGTEENCPEGIDNRGDRMEATR